ncbi:type I restriction endonuclease subunit M, partial [Escherichia coli]
SLFEPAREGYSKALVKASEVKSTILNHDEFKTFAAQSLIPFTEWAQRSNLHAIAQDEPPKQIIHRISEDLLQSYAQTP